MTFPKITWQQALACLIVGLCLFYICGDCRRWARTKPAETGEMMHEDYVGLLCKYVRLCTIPEGK